MTKITESTYTDDDKQLVVRTLVRLFFAAAERILMNLRERIKDI